MTKKIQKPFDAEAAKNGARVETRGGKSVRIVCYDRAKTAYPIVGLVNYERVESCFTYSIEGKTLINETNEDDLVIIEEVECPKFNVGDWVFAINCTGCPSLITAITPHCYELQCNGYKTEMYQTTVDAFYRLWTLKDAKSGDILCYKDNRPFMFKELRDGYPVAYFGIDYEDSILIGNGLIWTKDSVRPATSNEKGVLFKKIEEEGYKWDADTLTLSKIQKRWRDKENYDVSGYFIQNDSKIVSHLSGHNTSINYNVFATEKQAKSALAMARISQIMANDERFGGVVTDEEWGDNYYTFVIIRTKNGLQITLKYYIYHYLAFHTKEQAELFLKENEDLVKDYYMME